MTTRTIDATQSLRARLALAQTAVQFGQPGSDGLRAAMEEVEQIKAELARREAEESACPE